jgi:hypothetical protein
LAALSATSELPRPADGADARFVAYYAQTLTGFMRGQNRQARETAEAFLREAEGRPTEEGVARRVLGFVLAIASALFFKAVLESRRDDFSSTRLAVEPLLALTEEHNLKTYADVGRVYANWARGRQVDPESWALGLRQALESYVGLGNRAAVHRSTECLQNLRP